MSNLEVVFEAVPSRWVIECQNPGKDWELIERKPTLEEAKERAQREMDYPPSGSTAVWRVVDTQPDEAQPDEAQPDTVHAGDETPLTLDQYQQQATKTAVYPTYKADQYLIAGLAGEVGEVSSIFAKVWRGDGNLKFPHAAAELGDVLWFVAMLAYELGYDLSEVAQNNLDKLADRAERGKLKGSGDNR